MELSEVVNVEEEDREEQSSEPESESESESELSTADLHTILGPGNYLRLAQATGLSKPHVSRVLRGITKGSDEVRERIAVAAGVGVDDVGRYVGGLTGSVSGRKPQKHEISLEKKIEIWNKFHSQVTNTDLPRVTYRSLAEDVGVSRETVARIVRLPQPQPSTPIP